METLNMFWRLSGFQSKGKRTQSTDLRSQLATILTFTLSSTWSARLCSLLLSCCLLQGLQGGEETGSLTGLSLCHWEVNKASLGTFKSGGAKLGRALSRAKFPYNSFFSSCVYSQNLSHLQVYIFATCDRWA